MYNRQRLSRVSRPAPPTYKEGTLPASVGGINALDPLMEMPPRDCIYAYNLVPSENGLRLRKGYREWASNLPSAVRTLLPYQGSSADGSDNKLWAVCAEGIYDVTLFNTTAPTQDANFTINVTGEAGFGTYTEFTNDTDAKYMFYADAENGLWRYDESLGTWAAAAGITGVTAADLSFVTVWKQRLWVVEQDSSVAWYLPLRAISGAATRFSFGTDFVHGGELLGLYTWTIDGGDGVDDYLIAISRGGDVLVYRGSDPAASDFGMVGRYFVGRMPNSRRAVVSHGGELYIVSSYGITSVRDLLNGVYVADNDRNGPAAKVNRLIRTSVQAGINELQWSLHINPSDGFMQLVSPYPSANDAVQYTQNILTGAWGAWKGVPVNSAAAWKEEYYIGDEAGSVFIYDGVLDGTLLDGTLGTAVEYNILTSFQVPNGAHSRYKIAGIIRAIGIIAGSTSFNIQAVYDYDIQPYVSPATGLATGDASLWDSGSWDEALWDSSSRNASFPVGVAGIGRSIAVAMRGSAFSRIEILGWDVSYKQGGFL